MKTLKQLLLIITNWINVASQEKRKKLSVRDESQYITIDNQKYCIDYNCYMYDDKNKTSIFNDKVNMKNLPLQIALRYKTEYHGFCYTVKYNDNNETLIYSSINLQCWEEITEEQYLEIKNKGEKLKPTPLFN